MPRLVKKIVQSFYDAGWEADTPVGVVYRASWPDQKIIRTTLEHLEQDLRDNGIRSQAMILAGKALDPRLVDSEDFRSKLYDPTFTHQFRKGIK